MIRIKLVLSVLCCLAAFLSSTTPQAIAVDTKPPDVSEAAAAAAPVFAEPDYRVVEEDVLKLDVWGEMQLSNQQMQVTPDGKLNIPFLGDVQASGLTLAELTNVIVKMLADAGIIYDAKVQLTLISMHKPTVRVLGRVQRPGPVEFKDGDCILDALSGAGSNAEDAWLEKATITHKGSDKPIAIDLRKMLDGDLSQNYVLQKGDTIYLPPEDYQNKVYVLGYVLRPGLYSLKDKTTVLAAIMLAGGPQERGALRSTVVVRGDPAKPERVQCNLTRLFDKADLSQDIVLKPGDVVVVPETKRPDWGKVSQIFGTIMNLSYLRRYGLF